MINFLNKLAEKGIFIRYIDEKLSLFSENNDIDSELLQEIKSKKEELIVFLKNNDSILENSQEYKDIPKIPEDTNYPLSSSQLSLWLLSQFEGGSLAYNMSSSVMLEGSYDLQKFQKAVHCLIERHEILRTVFRENENGDVRQWILPLEELNFSIDYLDVSNKKNKEESSLAYMRTDSKKEFDLTNGPLIRTSLIKLHEDSYIFYYNMHHIISDGWSMNVLKKDLMSFYDALAQDQELNMEALRIQYKDYTVWQLNRINESGFSQHREYWLRQMSGELPIIDLPSSKSRPKVTTYNGAMLSTYISAELTKSIKDFIQENGGSLFTALVAFLNVQLHKYTSLEDIIIGTIVAGRNHSDLQEQIGFYVNAVALRNHITPDENFTNFYKRIKDNTLESFEHQDYPFQRLISDLGIIRNPDRSAIFDVMIDLQNTREISEEFQEDIDSDKIFFKENVAAKYDIQLTFQEVGEHLLFLTTYNTDVYEYDVILQFVNHFKLLISNILTNPINSLASADYLTESERKRLLVDFNATTADYEKDGCITSLFEMQVNLNPNKVAVTFNDKDLSYLLLHELSNKLANYIDEKLGSIKKEFIGIKLERNENFIIAMLAILKVGCAYVPIDMDYPEERIFHMLSDTNCSLVIDTAFVKSFTEKQSRLSEKYNYKETSKGDLAYIMYTSGSTGKPKGVMISQQNVVSLVRSSNYFNSKESHHILGLSNFSFDGATFDIFMPLLNGGSLTIASKDVFLDFEAFRELLEVKQITAFFTTTALFNLIVDSKIRLPKSVRTILFGGELVSVDHVKRFMELHPKVNLRHVYGPTENTTFSTYFDIDDVSVSDNTIPIGLPINNSSAYILDTNTNLVPVGIVGELYVGGAGVALGYLNNNTLTKERFVENPFKNGERLYKTGDLCRRRTDGSIEFIDRSDNQVKIRGHRIELGEIEHQLQIKESIKDVIVLVKATGNDKHLAAYFVSEIEEDGVMLNDYLAQRLPDYMIPRLFTQLEQMPITSNGKVDKTVLLSMDATISSEDYKAPETDLERVLVEIWEDLLRKERIGIHDNFFKLGGHSLKIAELRNIYNKRFEVLFGFKEFFENYSIKLQANLIESSKKERFIEIEKIPEAMSYELSFEQQRLYATSQFEALSSAYNISYQIPLDGAFYLDDFAKAIDQVIDRHEILRTVFKENEDGEVRQMVLDRSEINFKVGYEDYRNDKNALQKIEDYISKDKYAPFQLSEAPLMRANLMQLEDEHYIFYFNMHHIISDEWSMEILLRDVIAYYEFYQNSKDLSLPELGIQYKDYAIWQKKKVSEISNEDKSYWLKMLSGKLPVLDLPGQLPRPRVKTSNGVNIQTYISAKMFNDLQEFCLEHGGSMFMGTLTVWFVLFHKYTKLKDIIIGTPVLGRDHPDLKDQIGCFINNLAIRAALNPQESFLEIFQKIKELMLNNYKHQEYPYDRIIDALETQNDISRNLLFDVMFSYHNISDKSAAELPENTTDIIDLGFSSSKLDLLINFSEYGDGLIFNILYNTDVYDSPLVKELINNYKRLVSKVLEQPTVNIADLDYQSEVASEFRNKNKGRLSALKS